MQNVLEKYWQLIAPKTLKNDEYIRVTGFKEDKKAIVQYLKSADELFEFVKKYRYNYNLYMQISTVFGTESGTINKLLRRQVLFFDFDRKDFPDNIDFTSNYITNMLKTKIPDLFNHAIVNSGNGYHVYVATESSHSTTKLTQINRELAEILGADLNACKPTQLMRIPTSYNLKNDEQKSVKIVTNVVNTRFYKPYKLDRLQGIADFKKRNDPKVVIDENTPTIQTETYTKESTYYCIEKMLAEGASKGERNFCLGRITKYLQLKGYSEHNAVVAIKEWNLKCKPVKNENEVVADFKAYWIGEYNLLGCKIADVAKQSILDNYCDRYKCKSNAEGRNNNVGAKELNMDRRFFDDKLFRELTGNEYLLLTIFSMYDDKIFTIDELKIELTGLKNTICMSNPTLINALKKLSEKKFITRSTKKDKKTGKQVETYSMKEHSNYKGYMRLYWIASAFLINKVISPKDFVVYLCLNRNLHEGKSVDYDSLGYILNMEASNISTYIKRLHKAKLISIKKVPIASGGFANQYTLLA